MDFIRDESELRPVVGTPIARVQNKVRQRLHALDRAWLQASPFCLVSTADAQGRCDVSPKGDPAGFVHVVDDTTIALPERPGNRRADGYLNVLSNPHVGLLFLIPGRGDTLRINGKARIVRDAAFFDAMIVEGHRPLLALLVEIEEVFFHCAKAFLRSELWQPARWRPEAVPSRAEIARTLERPEASIEELERYYGPEYLRGLYASTPAK